jgi:outer membrane lipoprotein SlyB
VRLVALLSIFLLMACATVDGQGRYRIATIGNAKRSVAANVLTVKSVLVKKETTGAGSSFGGATGGAIALSNSNNIGVIFAGIIAGAVVGEALEGSANVFKAHEYVIETSNGNIFTVVQIDKDNPIFSRGDAVILVYGYPSQLIADPR